MVKNQIGLFGSSKPSQHCHARCSTYLYFKVPADQRKANPDAYQPYLFSFGVYHAAIPRPATSLVDGNTNVGAYHSRDAPASTSSGYRVHECSISADSIEGLGFRAMMQREAASDAYRDALEQWHSCSSDDGDHLKHSIARTLLKDGELSNLVASIQEHDAELRRLYIQMPPHKLNAISPGSLAFRLALDSITIVAAALIDPGEEAASPMIYPITRLAFSDAILLENQIPIFILFCAIEALRQRRQPADSLHFNGESSSPEQADSFRQVLEWYCERASPFPELINKIPTNVDVHSRKPLLHYIYNYLTQAVDAPQQQLASTSRAVRPYPTSSLRLRATNSRKSLPGDVEIPVRDEEPSSLRPAQDPSLPSASHLARCGVKFTAHDGGFQRITLNSTRWKAELKIPRIAVSDNTVRCLHNLLAYEATARYPTESFVISYVHFMDCLIDTEEDVHVLVDAGVIRNVLGSHTELASMWNKLCISVSCRMTKNDKDIMAQVEALAKQRWRRWWASYKEKYWEKQPWLIVSVVMALILLVLTLLQTIYTMKGSNT